MKIKKNPLKLYASPKAVITLFLTLPGKSRVNHIIIRIKNLNEKRGC